MKFDKRYPVLICCASIFLIKLLGLDMRVFKILLVILFSVLLSGCGDESNIKAAVKKDLKDPDSAKFGKITIFTAKDKKDQKGNTINAACATVNAKNGFGGYTGDKQAYLLKIDGEWTFVTFFGESN